MKFHLVPQPPYDFSRCAWVYSHFPADGADLWFPPRETLPAEHRRLHVVEGTPVLACVQEDPAGKGRLLVGTHPAKFKGLSLLRERISWQFNMDASPREFYRLARKDSFFRPLLKILQGVKPLRPPTLFEMAVIAITEQQISQAAAAKIRSRMIMALGAKLIFEGREYRAFPTPERLAGCAPGDLRALSQSNRKAEYVVDLARKVASGEVDLESLRRMPAEEVVHFLTSLRGFGRWSAEYFLSRGLGRMQIVAADDLGIQTLVGKYLGPGRRVIAEECRRILEPWGASKRWAVFYLICAYRLGLLA